MAIDAYAIGDTIDRQARELNTLDQSVAGLRRDLDALTERHETLDQQFTIIEMDTIEPLRRSVTDLEETAEQLGDDLTQTRVVVRHLCADAHLDDGGVVGGEDVGAGEGPAGGVPAGPWCAWWRSGGQSAVTSAAAARALDSSTMALRPA